MVLYRKPQGFADSFRVSGYIVDPVRREQVGFDQPALLMFAPLQF